MGPSWPDGGHRAVDGGAGGGRVVVGGRVVEQVDHAVEVGLVPDGQLHRGHARPEGGPDLGQRAVEVGPLPVELVDDDHPRHAEAGGRPPGILGLGLHAVGRAHDDDGQVDVGQGGDHLAGEVGVAGGVDQVDLHPVDREGGQAGRDRQLARHLLGLEVHDGGALLHRPPPCDGPRRGQEGLGQRGLAGAMVPDEGDVADSGRVVWHLVLRLQLSVNRLVGFECTTDRELVLRVGRIGQPRPGAAGSPDPARAASAASYSWRTEKRMKRPIVSTRSSTTALSEIVLPKRSWIRTGASTMLV